MPPKKAFAPKKACDNCYAKKTVCSLPTPEGPCERCVYRGLVCTFERKRPYKKRRIRSPRAEASNEVQTLSQRVEDLENALSTRQNVVDTANISLNTYSPPSAGKEVLNFENSPSSVTLLGGAPKCTSSTAPWPEYHINSSVYQLGPNWFFDSIPIFSEAGRQWLSKRTDQDVNWTDSLGPITESFNNPSLHSFASQESLDLPNKDAVQEIIRSLFRSSFILTFPVLEECLFQTTVECAYGTMNEASTPAVKLESRACVCAALSIATRLAMSKEMIPSIDGDEYAAKAHFLLNNLADNISLERLQTILLLQIHYMFQGSWKRASLLNSMASVTICSLKGHFYNQPARGTEKADLQRNNSRYRILFWLIYMLDKDLAIRTGDPPLLTESYCDLTISVDFFDYYNYLPRLDETGKGTGQRTEHHTPHFPGDVGLSLLKEKACHQLFSAHASKCSDNQLLLRIRKLDDEIESWRVSLPSTFRPALSISHNTSLGSSEEAVPFLTRRMSLQLEYYHLMTVVHTTVRRCAPGASSETEDLHAVVHSSFDLSLMASRSTLLCLKLLLDKIGRQAFRFFTSYFSTAAITLFLDIVIHPLGTQARDDLEVLISAANTVRSMSVHSLTKNEVARVEGESKFAMRLVWLGTCAITKADCEK